MDPLLNSECPISIFSGLGGDGLSCSSLDDARILEMSESAIRPNSRISIDSFHARQISVFVLYFQCHCFRWNVCVRDNNGQYWFVWRVVSVSKPLPLPLSAIAKPLCKIVPRSSGDGCAGYGAMMISAITRQ